LAKAKRTTYQVNEPGIDDAITLAGILAGGGIAGQAQNALSQFEEGGDVAALQAFLALIMGALGNHSTRDEIRLFLFRMWRTTEDEQASEEDLGIDDRLKPVYADGELTPGTPYHRKLKRFYKLPMSGLSGIATAFYNHPQFPDFLDSLRDFLPAKAPTSSAGKQTESNGSTPLEAVR
jgi:hypothetical protein